jgi:predicted ester cyclase
MVTQEQVIKAQETAKKNKVIIEKVYRIFSGGNLDELEKFINPNFAEFYKDPRIEGSGLEYLKNLMRMNREAFPDIKFTINEILTDGDKSVVYSTLTGTNMGSFMGKPATNRSVNLDGIDICEIINGKLTQHWGVWDNLKLLQQLGIVPEKLG